MEVSLLEYYDYIDESEWEYDIPTPVVKARHC